MRITNGMSLSEVISQYLRPGDVVVRIGCDRRFQVESFTVDPFSLSTERNGVVLRELGSGEVTTADFMTLGMYFLPWATMKPWFSWEHAYHDRTTNMPTGEKIVEEPIAGHNDSETVEAKINRLESKIDQVLDGLNALLR